MGSWRMQGRERFVVPLMALVVVLGGLGAWKVGAFDSGGGDRRPAGPSDEAGAGAGAGTDDDDVRLADADFDLGDCVTWDGGIGMFETDTEVVPCTVEHRVQMSEEVSLENDGGAYPTEDEWGLMIESLCRPAAERLLGVPLDPRGRFHPYAIRPVEAGWDDGEDTMWCGVGSAGPADGSASSVAATGDDVLWAEDARGADQAFHYPAGSCVATPPAASPVVVPCGDGHHVEIVGEIDLSDRSELPVGSQARALFDDCAAQSATYLGGDPEMPWQVGKETMTEESWAAGSRVVHCFLGRWDADGRLIEVTGSAKG